MNLGQDRKLYPRAELKEILMNHEGNPYFYWDYLLYYLVSAVYAVIKCTMSDMMKCISFQFSIRFKPEFSILNFACFLHP